MRTTAQRLAIYKEISSCNSDRGGTFARQRREACQTDEAEILGLIIYSPLVLSRSRNLTRGHIFRHTLFCIL